MAKTVEQRLQQWASQAPGLRVAPAEQQFIADMRKARAAGVGFGWMQQVIEWEWNAVSATGGWGPEYYDRLVKTLEAEIERLKAEQA